MLFSRRDRSFVNWKCHERNHYKSNVLWIDKLICPTKFIITLGQPENILIKVKGLSHKKFAIKQEPSHKIQFRALLIRNIHRPMTNPEHNQEHRPVPERMGTGRKPEKMSREETWCGSWQRRPSRCTQYK